MRQKERHCMKKRIALLFGLLLAFALVVSVGAAGDKTVVYLKNGGTGDGSSALSPLSSLKAAYDALDLSKDCTIVLCGIYTQTDTFSYGKAYDGSVTITSVYDGKDYRTSGASYQFKSTRFVCFGATAFENMDFAALEKSFLLVGQHNPITIGEGVTMKGEDMTGGSVAKAFCILGGYQNGQDNPPTESDKDTNITILSGSKMNVVAFSRQIMGNYTGTANITIGGNAEVVVLNCTAVSPNGVSVGDTVVTIEGDALVKSVYGCLQDTTVNSVTFNWKSGNINKFEWVSSYTPSRLLTCNTPTKLIASEEVQKSETYATISANFDEMDEGEEAFEPMHVIAASVVVKSNAPVTEAPVVDVPAESGAPVGLIIGIVVAVIAAAAVVVVVLKKKGNK